MDIFANSIDLLRLAFLIGAVFALLYKKQVGVTPGGIIVPGALTGILLKSFVAFMITLIAASVCVLLYEVLFSRFAFKKRVAALINISLSVVIGLLSAFALIKSGTLSQELSMMSMVLPGLISISSQRYGYKKVMAGTLLVTAITSICGLALALVIPQQLSTSLTVQLSAYQPLFLPHPFISIPLSLLAAIAVYYTHGLRGGGYLIAPFIANVAFSAPLQALLLAISVATCYALVRIIQQFTLVIGLERFVLSLFLAYLAVTFIDIYAVTVGISHYRPAPFILLIAVAVLTNELCLQSPGKALFKGFTPSIAMAILTRWAI